MVLPPPRYGLSEGQEDDKAQIQAVLDLTWFEALGTRLRELLQRALIKTFDLPYNTGVVGLPPA